jgi:hypothetical protein
MSSRESSKSSTSRFSVIRSGFEDFRDRDVAVLNVPAKDDLSARSAELRGDPGDRLVGERGAVVSERTVRLDSDPMLCRRRARPRWWWSARDSLDDCPSVL